MSEWKWTTARGATWRLEDMTYEVREAMEREIKYWDQRMIDDLNKALYPEGRAAAVARLDAIIDA